MLLQAHMAANNSLMMTPQQSTDSPIHLCNRWEEKDKKKKVKGSVYVFVKNPSQSYGASPAMW